MKLHKLLIALIIGLASTTVSFAQQKQDPEEQQKKMYEAIDKEIERLENSLDLEDWQVFKVDSIYTHDYMAMTDELQELQKKKIENLEIYYDVQDKWMEQIYQSFSKVFDEDQWAKYLKQGAERAKKNRDKRAAKSKK